MNKSFFFLILIFIAIGCGNPKPVKIEGKSKDVVLVNLIGKSRSLIYKCLKDLKKGQPAVIGLDIYFDPVYKGPFDSLLRVELNDFRIATNIKVESNKVIMPQSSLISNSSATASILLVESQGTLNCLKPKLTMDYI